MEHQQAQTLEKIPIPRQPSTSQRKFRQFKSPSAKQAEKRLRDSRRICIGESFKRWQELRELMGYKSNEELAMFLMDSYESGSETPTSAPFKKQLFTAPVAIPAPTSIHGDLSERHEEASTSREPYLYSTFHVTQVTQSASQTREGEFIHSIAGRPAEIPEEIDADELNNIAMSMLESDYVIYSWSPSQETDDVSTYEEEEAFEMEECDDSDNDEYIPPYSKRTGAALRNKKS